MVKIEEMKYYFKNAMVTCLVSITLTMLPPEVTAVLAGSTKNYDWNSKAGELENWKTAGIGEECEPKVIIRKKISEMSKDEDEMVFREAQALKHCDSNLKLACIFEVPHKDDKTKVILVCDCEGTSETWDMEAKECRRYAGRKQNCTEDSQCVTGAMCKNEELKLREYSRWEEAVLEKNNLTTPRSFLHKNSFGKVQFNINDARRRRKRILSRIVRHSYKEEIGECTCKRTELDLNIINRTDPCIARKHPPPLHLNHAPPSRLNGQSVVFASITLLFRPTSSHCGH